MGKIRDEQHWRFEDYKQRITTKQWREMLLDEDDSVIFHGRLRKLVFKKLGAGVIEVSKEPLEEKTNV